MKARFNPFTALVINEFPSSKMVPLPLTAPLLFAASSVPVALISIDACSVDRSFTVPLLIVQVPDCKGPAFVSETVPPPLLATLPVPRKTPLSSNTFCEPST